MSRARHRRARRRALAAATLALAAVAETAPARADSPPAAGATPAGGPTISAPAPATTAPATTQAATAPAAPPAPQVVAQRRQAPTSPAGPKRSGKGKKGKHRSATPPKPSPTSAPPPPSALSIGAPNPLAGVLGVGPLPDLTGLAPVFVDNFRVPLFLLPILRAAGERYDIPWQVLAAINEVETDYGRDLSVSTAGAEGWMQFMPAEWALYGVDATGAGSRDPYDPADAIFSAASYLAAAGGAGDLHGAVYAYNHSDAYVASVLLRARLLAGMPAAMTGALTELADGHFPVAAAGHPRDASPAPVASPSTSAASPSRRGLTIVADRGALAVAVRDGRIVRVGRDRALGRFLELRDTDGNTYVYGGLGTLAVRVPVARLPVRRGSADTAATPAVAPHPNAPATGGALPAAPSPSVRVTAPAVPALAPVGGSPRAAAQVRIPAHAVAAAQSARRPSPGAHPPVDAGRGVPAIAAVAPLPPVGESFSALVGSAAAPTPSSGRVSVNDAAQRTAGIAGAPRSASLNVTRFTTVLAVPWPAGGPAHAARSARASGSGPAGGSTGAPRATGPAVGAGAPPPWFTTGLGLGRSQVVLHPLRVGSRVLAGTILARLGGAGSGTRLTFAIEPAGISPRTIDPRPFLDAWAQLDTSLMRRRPPADSLAGPEGRSLEAAALFARTPARVDAELQADDRVALGPCAARELAAGQVDRRVVASAGILAATGARFSLSIPHCGHDTGTAAELRDLRGVTGRSLATRSAVRRLQALEGPFRAGQTLTPAKGSLIVQYLPTQGPAAVAARTTTPIPGKRWAALDSRLVAIPQPAVFPAPSAAALPDRQTGR